MLHLLSLGSTVDVYQLGNYFWIFILLCEPLRTDSTSAKWILVTGSINEHEADVGRESLDSQIAELTGPMQWPSVIPGSVGDKLN